MTGPHTHPYSYDEAKQAIERASQAMLAAEQRVRDAYREAAAAEQAYRIALADKILHLKADGVAWTACQDVARGDNHVAELRFKRDVAEGVREAAVSAQWRHTADRRELEQLVNWSMRVAPDGQQDAPADAFARGPRRVA